jgi:hypothetical protein
VAAALKPWYKIVTPREDLREGKPLDAAEFAVHLDRVRDGTAPKDYTDPERFFERTFLTVNLQELAAEVVRRLSGETTATSAVFNMATQFGGGKTHALTLLYHLAEQGPEADRYTGVNGILAKSGVKTVPKAATAVFVGTEFDSITGRGGSDGTPLRKTPWGEIAFQLGGAEAFAVVKEHDKKMIAPSGEVILKFMPEKIPCIILMDELMNYVNRFRQIGLSGQLHSFLQNLSQVAASREGTVLVVSIPASELEMTTEDHTDYDRFKKLLDRVGKPVIMAVGSETSEIIRRRLFEWDGIPSDAKKVIEGYVHWTVEHRSQLPGDFPADHATARFRASYPFHPAVLSVFERKWQTLPRFQQTRGVLRLLALWISHQYRQGFTESKKDLLIDIGSAPLDDSFFRAALFEQLGETRLEAAVTADIAGREDSRAVALDDEAGDAISRQNLHRRVATSIFFESNGGQTQTFATLPEIRFAVSRPDIDLANIETVLEALAPPNGACYYLHATQNRYWFSLKPNLNKIHSDRMATVASNEKDAVNERVTAEIQKVFAGTRDIKPIFFPDKASQVPDRAELTLVVLPPNLTPRDPTACQFVQTLIRDYGSTSARTFKSALLFAMAEESDRIHREAQKLIAWELIADDSESLGLDEIQRKQVLENGKNSGRDLNAAVWWAYRYVIFLSKNNDLQQTTIGPNTPERSTSLTTIILNRLMRDDIIASDIAPNYLVRKWPPALEEWPTKGVRDIFFASPVFSRLLNPDIIKTTIAKGVSEGRFAYVGKTASGEYKPCIIGESISPGEIEISDDMFIVTPERLRQHQNPPEVVRIEISPCPSIIAPGQTIRIYAVGKDAEGKDIALNNAVWEATRGMIDQQGNFTAGTDLGPSTISVTLGSISVPVEITVSKKKLPKKQTLTWSGEIQPQKWMNFYTKVLSRFATKKGLTIEVTLSVNNDELTEQTVEETKSALREIGLDDAVGLKSDVSYQDREED